MSHRIAHLPYETGRVLSGIGKSELAICEALARLDNENDYFILSDSLDLDERWQRVKFLKNTVGLTDASFVTGAYDFDLLHSNTAAFSISDKLKCKTVFTINDIRPISHPGWDTKVIEEYFDIPVRETVCRSDAIIAISEYTKSEIVKYYPVPEEKIEVIPLGVYPKDRFEGAGEKPGFENIVSGNYILFVSGLDKNKNQKGLIEAFGVFKSRHGDNDIKLVLTGPERKSDELAETEKRFPGLKNDIIYTGYVSDDELVWLYKNALAFVYPSFFEGFGLPVLEAMSVGQAVISSNTTSLPEVGGDAVDYCDPYDTGSIVDSMERVIFNDGYRDELKKKAIRRAGLFSYENTAEMTMEVYKRLIQDK